MQYLIIEKETDELFDIIQLNSDKEKLNYEKNHPEYYLEEASEEASEEEYFLDEGDEW